MDADVVNHQRNNNPTAIIIGHCLVAIAQQHRLVPANGWLLFDCPVCDAPAGDQDDGAEEGWASDGRTAGGRHWTGSWPRGHCGAGHGLAAAAAATAERGCADMRWEVAGMLAQHGAQLRCCLLGAQPRPRAGKCWLWGCTGLLRIGLLVKTGAGCQSWWCMVLPCHWV
jgi:hypothetical protein